MHEKIDDALNKIISMTVEEYAAFKPSTIAEKLAKVLIDETDGENSVRAIQIIAERSGGRATAKAKEEVSGNGKLADIMLEIKKGNRL